MRLRAGKVAGWRLQVWYNIVDFHHSLGCSDRLTDMFEQPATLAAMDIDLHSYAYGSIQQIATAGGEHPNSRTILFVFL